MKLHLARKSHDANPISINVNVNLASVLPQLYIEPHAHAQHDFVAN